MADQPSKESLERVNLFIKTWFGHKQWSEWEIVRLALEFDAIAKELRQQNATLVSALRDALDKCRSSMSIAQREGRDVNWLAWRNQLNASIYRQAAALAAYARAEEKEKP